MSLTESFQNIFGISFDFYGSFTNWLPYLAAVVGILVIYNLIVKLVRRHYQTSVAFKKAVLMVMVPKKDKVSSKDDRPKNWQEIQEQISATETFFSALGGLRAQRGLGAYFLGREDHLSFEIVATKGVISFYLAVPKYMQKFLEEQIQAQLPAAVIEEVEDYNLFNPQGDVAGAYLKFTRPFYFPIKSYRKLENDPLNGLTNALSKITKEEGACIQFIVRSAKKEWHRPGPAIAREMQQGKKLKAATAKVNGNFLFNLISDGVHSIWKSKDKEMPKDYRLSPLEEEMVKGLEEKSSKAGMDCNILILVSAANRETAKSKLDNVVNAFNQYSIYEYGNGFKPAYQKNLNKLVQNSIYRHYSGKYHLLFNAEEMSSLFHLPLESTETPNIQWLLARKAPSPINMPKEGPIIGKNVYRNIETLVRMKRSDRRRHLYMIGMTGSGKSTMQANIAEQDIKNGEGLCVIDPHGDMALELLSKIPKERIDDVVYFDPSDFERPMALNLLEIFSPEQKTFVINEMINIMDKLYDLRSTGGPMFEQYMRNAMQLVMDDPESGSTLVEIPKVLADQEFRNYKLSKCKNQIVIDFWTKEAEKAGGEASLANMVPYITSKLTPFIANDLMRPIISQQVSAIDFRKVMDNQQILLINLSKGKIGEMNANLLGMVIIGKLLIAALSRVEIPEDQRKDFYLYIDEFQNFLTDSISIILSEARKYRLGLVIAHQFIGQLVKNNDTRIRDAIFGNVGNMISFKIGVDDAEFMAKQFAPVFNEYDLINVPKFNAYMRLLIDNENPPPFNMVTIPPSKGDLEIREAARQLSRLKYGRDRRIVEAEIAERQAVIDKKVSGKDDNESINTNDDDDDLMKMLDEDDANDVDTKKKMSPSDESDNGADQVSMTSKTAESDDDEAES